MRHESPAPLIVEQEAPARARCSTATAQAESVRLMIHSVSAPDAAALLVRVAARDSAALATLYDQYGRQAFAVAYRIVGTPEGAEEVVQDSFLALWRRAEQYVPGRGSVRGWLLTIVRNRALDSLRARHARPQPTVSIDDVAMMHAGAHDTELLAFAGIEATAVRAAVRDLTPLHRQTVELAYFGGFTYQEVAVQMGTPLGTVKSRMRLALTSLRLALTPPLGAA